MDSFTPLSNADLAPVESSLDTVQQPIDNRGETAMMLEFVGMLTEKIQPRSPLWYHDELEKACNAGWLLSTKDVHHLIGVKPIGDVFDRGCWRFVRSGKIGAQTAWRVEKG
jgi:hypothetical protein